ncbi:MAG TPA: hypothetical protein VMW17_24035 [Candidatus Binatia bacterium]|nr:hypothetical protein [Candidatus Binatia bacterium]
MYNTKRVGWAVVAALPLIIGQSHAVRALTRSDRPAAVVIYPQVEACDVTKSSICPGNLNRDTLIVLSNTKANSVSVNNSVTAHCFYLNANSHCTNSGNICTSSSQCQNGTFGSCVPGWTETDFNVTLTPDQPLSWSALNGLRKFPITGLTCSTDQSIKCLTPGASCGLNGTCGFGGNSGSLVPPAPEIPFVGELKCIEVDPATQTPFGGDARNDLKGEATLEQILDNGTLDVAKYDAVGVIANDNNDGNSTLTLSMGDEYEDCAPVIVFDHLFDGAVDPIDSSNTAQSDLTLVPCSEDLQTGNTGSGASTAQFLVFNEFEQRFSTSRRVDCHFNSALSLIDTTQPTRSIFNAKVTGTVAGQTRIRSVGGGLTGVARLSFVTGTSTVTTVGSAAYNLHQDVGERDTPDTIQLP